MDYQGCSTLNKCDEISSANFTPEMFFEKYVSTRKPVKFIDNNGMIDMPSIGNKWTNSYLRQCSGKELVKVEVRDSCNGRFGLGNEIIIKFGEFLDSLENGDDLQYLTTQDLDYDFEGKPSLVSTPLSKLMHDLPWRPSLCGNLITQNINLWFGSSRQPSTSGLHHDFHDNLYIVLRGEKRITLFSPAEYRGMYTVGEIVKMHPNGRINYSGQLTEADGSDQSSMKAVKASSLLETAAEKLSKAEIAGENTDDIEDEIDEALEEALNAEMEDQCSGSEEENFDDADDDEGDEDFEVEDVIDEDSDEEKEDMQDEACSSSLGKRKIQDEEEEESLPRFIRKLLKSESSSSSSSIKEIGKKKQQGPPSNFSRVNTENSKDEEFPLFRDALTRKLEVTVKAGEMLYIPAGWFHEVRSISLSCPDGGPVPEGAVPLPSPGPGHMAVNYWFHPPDNHDFRKPYTSEFWLKDWVARGLPI